MSDAREWTGIPYPHPVIGYSRTLGRVVAWDLLTAEDHEYAAAFLVRFTDEYMLQYPGADPDGLTPDGELIAAHQAALSLLRAG